MLREVARKDFLTILNDWSPRGPISRNFAKTDWIKAAGYSWGVRGGWAVVMAAGKAPSQVIEDAGKPHACCSLQVQAEIKRKWRSWKVNRYFTMDFKHRHPSLASSGVNGGTQLSILSKSSSQLRMSSLPADNLAT